MIPDLLKHVESYRLKVVFFFKYIFIGGSAKCSLNTYFASEARLVCKKQARDFCFSRGAVILSYSYNFLGKEGDFDPHSYDLLQNEKCLRCLRIYCRCVCMKAFKVPEEPIIRPVVVRRFRSFSLGRMDPLL